MLQPPQLGPPPLCVCWSWRAEWSALVSVQCVSVRVGAIFGCSCHSLCRGANTGSDKDQKSILLQLLFTCLGKKKTTKTKSIRGWFLFIQKLLTRSSRRVSVRHYNASDKGHPLGTVVHRLCRWEHLFLTIGCVEIKSRLFSDWRQSSILWLPPLRLHWLRTGSREAGARGSNFIHKQGRPKKFLQEEKCPLSIYRWSLDTLI